MGYSASRGGAWATLALFVAGCATPAAKPTGWLCSSEATDGEFDTSVSMSLDAEGRELSASASTLWKRPGDDVELLIFQTTYNPSVADPKPRLSIVANPGKALRKRLAVVELGVGGAVGSLAGYRFAKRQPEEPQFQLTPDMDSLLAFARDKPGLEVAGFDRAGAALFRLPLDADVLARGRAALRRAVERPRDSIRATPGACRPLMPPSKDSIVIAWAEGGARLNRRR